MDISFLPPSEDQVAFPQPPWTQLSLLVQNLQELLIAYSTKFKLQLDIQSFLYLRLSSPLASCFSTPHGLPAQGASQLRSHARQ